ncbi:SepM family pheromone-processing serine protease [Mesobacillus jeotgali]|uniref:SepM family pheromone-processing serine protease n=1 Tax=Mesobacillus jeotgali TaxID=129985 RepID=UPI0009A7E6FC|nr:SepM family pheromone-processing serine protease [Mesobacillus jeotgali]
MNRKTSIGLSILGAILLMASAFYYLPYYVTKPGMAKELEPIVEVEDGYDEEGNFMLTTVRMGRANIYAYIIAKFSKYQELYPVEEIRAENESDEEYNIRQLHMMDNSKTAAIEVAYEKAGKQVDYTYKGVYVLRTMEGMPADGKLMPGDLVFKVDGNPFNSSEEFIKYISSKKPGDIVELDYKRNGKANKVQIPLKELDDGSNRPVVGIQLVDDKEIEVEPDVTVQSDEIGGPSAGLMFSLEIYNQLNEEDLTKGYQIAGTGTMSPDGTIGRIGGIQQKVVAADKAGAEIFLAPFEKGVKGSNYEEALIAAKDIKTKMKIVPVDTFDEAVSYLENLKEKSR